MQWTTKASTNTLVARFSIPDGTTSSINVYVDGTLNRTLPLTSRFAWLYGNEASPSHDGGLGFFPLYPMLMEALVWPLPGPATEAQLAFAAVIISNICFLVAAPMFADVVARRTNPTVARTATLLLCISPFSYFFSAG